MSTWDFGTHIEVSGTHIEVSRPASRAHLPRMAPRYCAATDAFSLSASNIRILSSRCQNFPRLTPLVTLGMALH